MADIAEKPGTAIPMRLRNRAGVLVQLRLAAILALVACVPLLLSPLRLPSAGIMAGAAMVAVLVLLVSIKQISDPVAALAFFLLGGGILALPPQVALAGFAADASWLILAGMILAAALNDCGLTDRLARHVLHRVGHSYASVILAIAALSLVLVFLVPSTTARVLLLVPIVLAFAARLGYGPDSKGFTGMVIAVSVLSYLPCTGVLTSNVRNLGVVGASQSLYGISFTYTEFLVWNFPFLSLTLTALFALLIIRRYGEPPRPAEADGASAPMDEREKEVLTIILCTLVLWMTDFLHGLPPAWVGLAAAVLCLSGPCREMPFAGRVKLGGWMIYVAFISLAAIIGHTGLGDWLGAILVEGVGLETGRTISNLAAITGIGLAMGLVTTNLAGPVVLTSLAEPIAAATGWSVQGTIIAMMPSWSVFFFAYQSPVILVAMRMAGVPLKELNLCLLMITAIALLVVIPLQFTWLWWLGLIV